MRVFEDFIVGPTIDHGPRAVSAGDIIAFAETYDPGNVGAGAATASGWRVALTFMQLMANSMLLKFDQHGLARHRDAEMAEARRSRRYHPRPLDRDRDARLEEPAGDGAGALPP